VTAIAYDVISEYVSMASTLTREPLHRHRLGVSRRSTTAGPCSPSRMASRVRPISRQGIDHTTRFRELAAALAGAWTPACSNAIASRNCSSGGATLCRLKKTRRRVLQRVDHPRAAFAGCRSSTAVSVPAAGVASIPRTATAAGRVSEAARVSEIEKLRKPYSCLRAPRSIRWPSRSPTRCSGPTHPHDADLNRQTVELVKPFIDWKHRMGEAQAKGKLRSLVWHDFFEHTARSKQNASPADSAVFYWPRRTGQGGGRGFLGEDHGGSFRVHRAPARSSGEGVDRPTRKSAELFAKLRADKPEGKTKALAEGQAMVAFKTTATKGIEEGKIKSIIHPTLADRVRREAVKFVDELKRA